MRTAMKFNPYETVPSWARFLSMEEFRALLEAVQNEIRSRGLLFEDHDGVLQIATPDGRMTPCPLAELALKCGATGREHYAREVAQYLQRVVGASAKHEEPPASFEEVRPLLKVRVYTEESLAESAAKVIARPAAPGLTAIVVYDFPLMVVSVVPDHLEQWNVSPDEAFRIGVANTGRAEIEREPFRIGAAATGFLLINQSGFGASQIFHLQSYLSATELGALVGFPNRHLLVCYPIQLATVLEALRELVPLVGAFYHDPPGGDERNKLSLDLYWWRKGSLLRMPAGFNVGLPGTVVAPPQEFIDRIIAKVPHRT
jgi:hypothetical protein